jgi:hypothetical protein
VTDDLLDQDAAAFAAANSEKVESTPRPPLPRRRSPLVRNLLIAFVVSLPLFAIGDFFVCGLYSCGFGGPNTLRNVSWFLCVAIGAIFAFAVNLALRGEHTARTRAMICVTLGITVAALCVVLMAAQL